MNDPTDSTQGLSDADITALLKVGMATPDVPADLEALAQLPAKELWADIRERWKCLSRPMTDASLAKLFGGEAFSGTSGGFADDSIQLVSVDTYREMIMPFHRAWYAMWSEEGPHGIHLCGDAGRHFPIIHEELNVSSFDTGYPLDHGWVRRTLGNDVYISGGTEASILLNGTGDQVYNRTREILESGIMEGGRFVLREANNLPPNCPEENLSAMYRCCLEHGNYQ